MRIVRTKDELAKEGVVFKKYDERDYRVDRAKLVGEQRELVGVLGEFVDDFVIVTSDLYVGLVE